MSTEAGQILDAAQAPQGTTDQPAPVTPKDEPIAGKLSVLMERERQALTRERLAKTQEEKLRDRLKKIEEFESVKTNPKKALEMLGLSYDDLTQSILKDGELPPSVEIQRLRDEITGLRDQLKQDKDLEAEEKKKNILSAETNAVTNFKSEIGEYLKGQSDRYELIDFEQAHELVYDVIDEHYNRTINPQTGTGKVMAIAEAADKVEKHLEEKYLKAKEKNKVKAFWSNGPKPLTDHLEKQKTSQPPKTLTNNMGPRTSERPNRPPEDQRIKQIVEEQVAKMRSQYTG